MNREQRRFIQFIVVMFLVFIAIMVVGALLVDPEKPTGPFPTTTPGTAECQPYQAGVICISATSVTR